MLDSIEYPIRYKLAIDKKEHFTYIFYEFCVQFKYLSDTTNKKTEPARSILVPIIFNIQLLFF